MRTRFSTRSRSPPHNDDHHINHRRRHIAMPEELLHRADVIAVFQQLGGKTVTHHMRTDALRDAGAPGRLRQRLLDHRLVQMVPGRRPESRIAADPASRKHKLPPPLGRRIRELAIQRERQDDSPESFGQITLMNTPHVLQVLRQRLPRSRGQHRHPILATLPLPHDDLIAIEVEILDAHVDTLLDPDAGPVEQHDDEPHRAGQLLQDRGHFLPAEHHR